MLKYINFKTRILLGFLSVIALMTVISASSLINLANTERDLTEINGTLLPNALLMGQMARDVVLVHQFLSDVSASHSPAGYGDAEKSAQDFKQGLQQFRQHIVGNDPKLKEADLLEANFDLFYLDGKRMAEAYINGGLDAGNAVMKDFDHESYQLSSQMFKLRNAEVNAAKAHVNAITETTHQVSSVLWSMSLMIFMLALGIAAFLTRHLSREIGIDPLYAKGIAKEIAAGDLSRNISLDKDDNDSLLHAIKNMQQKLLARRTAEQKAAAEIMRIKMALDNTSAGIMIADNYRNIIYANQSAINAFSKMESEIRMQIPSFSANELVGSNMDVFYQNPGQQAVLFAALTGTHSEDIMLGGRTMTVVANPIINQQNERIGIVTEWHDRTDEVEVEQDVSNIVLAAGIGDFSKRFELHGKSGFLRELGEGLNQMLYTNEAGLKDLGQVLEALARGDLSVTINNDYQGAFGQLKDNANMTVDKLREIVTHIKVASAGINFGAKEIAAGNDNLSYRTERQAESLEQTVASMQHLTVTVQANAEHAEQANQLAHNAAKIAKQGSEMADQVVTTMGAIKNSSLEIEKIISVIDDIAFQTNILAFNAAIESARAGEHGQGFAIVADEVHKLAQRAAESAAEIKQLIGDSVKRIDRGSALATRAGSTMNEIQESVRDLTGMMAQIAAASVKQSSGIEQINLALNHLDETTMQNAALVEQAAAAAKLLEQQAKYLIETVSGFSLESNPSTYHAAGPRQWHKDNVIHEVEFIPQKIEQERFVQTHKDLTLWEAVTNSGNKALLTLENIATAEYDPQQFAFANDADWESF